MNTTPNETQSRLLAKLIRSLLVDEEFATLTCLLDALKFKCARLKIAWTNDGISEALRLVESNTSLTTTRHYERHVTRSEDPGPSREEAAAILRRLGVNVP
jgi:hypothetical protein